MTKVSRKPEKTHRKMTDYFPRLSSLSIPSSPSRPPSSPPPSGLSLMASSPLSSPFTSPKAQKLHKLDPRILNSIPNSEDVISIPSDHPPFTSRTPITISSDSNSVIVISDSSPSKSKKPTLSSDGLEFVPVPKKRKRRDLTTPSARTTVHRTPASISPFITALRDSNQRVTRNKANSKRKLELDSDSEAVIVPQLVYVKRSNRSPSPVPHPDDLPFTYRPLLTNSKDTTKEVSEDVSEERPAPRPLTRASSKRPKLTHKPSHRSMTSGGHEADVEEVPSSQSDEQELVPPKPVTKNISEVKETVEAWRQGSSRASCESLDDTEATFQGQVQEEGEEQDIPMDCAFDDPSAGSLEDHVPAWGHHASADEVDVQAPQGDLKTPSVPLQGAFEEVNGAAMVAISECDNISRQPNNWEEPPTPPPDPQLSVRSVSPVVVDHKAKTAQTVAALRARAYAAAIPSPPKHAFDLDFESDSDDSLDFPIRRKSPDTRSLVATKPPPGDPSGRSLRHRSPTRSRLTGGSNRRMPTTLTSRPVSKISPLDKLAKKSRGHSTLLSAEALLVEIEDSQLAEPSGSAQQNSEDEECSPDLGDADCRALLGKTHGGFVSDMLRKDKQNDEEEQARKIGGIRLWDDDIGTQVADYSDPLFASSLSQLGLDPILSLLTDSVRQKDTAQMYSLLSAEILCNIPNVQLAALLPWLCNIAFFSSEAKLSRGAFNTLVQIPSRLSTSSCTLPASVVTSALSMLGAKSDISHQFGWACPTPCIRWTTESRHHTLFRLVAVVEAFSRHNAIVKTDLPHIVFALTLVAMDATIPHELVREIKVVLDVIVSSMQPVDAEVEILCKTLTEFAKRFSPCECAVFISLFTRSTPQSLRIGRWLAHSMILILDKRNSNTGYMSIPSLSPILDLLDPSVGSGSIFDILENANMDGYFGSLSSYVEILSTVFTGIEDYVESLRGLTSESDEDYLDQCARRFQELNGKIVDTKAADLDRSRVKAALQTLAFRIRYQKAACRRRLGKNPLDRFLGMKPQASS